MGRARRHKGALGYLNPLLYTATATTGLFRDVTAGTASLYPAKSGWDYASGCGAPMAAAFADVP